MEPVQAFKRGGRGAIGHYGTEKPSKVPEVHVFIDSDLMHKISGIMHVNTLFT